MSQSEHSRFVRDQRVRHRHAGLGTVIGFPRRGDPPAAWLRPTTAVLVHWDKGTEGFAYVRDLEVLDVAYLTDR